MKVRQSRLCGRSGGLAVVVVSSVLLGGTGVGPATFEKPCAIAGEVAPAFRGLEAALVAGDAARAAASARVLEAKGQAAAAALKPAVEVRIAKAMASAAGVAAARAGASDLPGAGAAAVEIAGACVSCHVRRKSAADSAQWFPARGNTIWGRVSIKDVAGKPVQDAANVVVFLDAVVGARPPAYAVAPPRVSQRGRKFRPSVLPVVLGSAVEFPNDDKIFHNAFSLSKSHPFDLGIYGRGKTRKIRPKRTGLIKVYCNIHSDMQCTILVLQNQCYGVTNSDGTYVITGVPDGAYTLRLWNNLGGGRDRRIEVTGSTATRVDYQIQQSKRAAAHRNKWGKRYRRKY